VNLTFLNEQIAKLERRIAYIENNPSRTDLKTNKELYELELNGIHELIEAWRADEPFAIMTGLEVIAKSLGFHAWNYIAAGDRVTDPQRYLNAAVQAGYSDHSCDRTLAALGLLLRGEAPLPKMVVSIRFACEPERLTTVAAAQHSSALYYALDNPLGWHYEGLRYVADQMGEMIELAESNIPGIRFDEERFLEMEDNYREARRLARMNYELRKRVPCPIAPKDAFRLDYLGDSKAGLAFMHRRLDEIADRADRGIGGVPEEKLRVAWMATGPFNRETFKILVDKGVSVPWFHFGGAASVYGLVPFGNHEERYGRKLSVLERMAEVAHFSGWAQTADYWVDPLIQACRDLKIDAVVDFLQPGCVVTKGLKKIVATRVQNELGIPVLDLEGRQFFSSPTAEAQMNERLSQVLDVWIENKER
jgi:benzoyl-CoA reductase/2-hydroxyglutaryl-CoA dehydratase subunit BcrC/BadD/HgdB